MPTKFWGSRLYRLEFCPIFRSIHLSAAIELNEISIKFGLLAVKILLLGFLPGVDFLGNPKQ